MGGGMRMGNFAAVADQGVSFDHPIHDRVEAFVKYMELDNPPAVRKKLGSSGKNPDGSSAPPNANASQRGGARVDDRNHEPTSKEIAKTARRLKKTEEEELDQKLQMTFVSYCRHKTAHGDMMGLTTYHKLLRQCKLLDNKFILSDADVLFTKMDAEHNDGYIHFQQFKTLLKHIGAYKFKKEAVEVAHLKVVADVLKFGGKMAADDSIADSMYSAEVLAVFRKRDATLKQIYAHYATLDMTSADVTSWKAVKQANRSININEVLIMLLNFEIVPHLVTKREALDVFRAVNLGPYADDFPDDLSFPEFQEYLGQLAYVASGNVDTKIRSPSATIMEISAARRYVGGCGDSARVHFYALLEDRAATVRKQKGIQDEEARVVAAEKVRNEQQEEMEKYYKAQLVAARRAAMTRMNARWSTDGFDSKPDANSTRRTQIKRTVTPRTLLARGQKNQRGTTYTKRAGEEGAAVKQMNAVALGLTEGTMGHFVEMDMEGHAVIADWKARKRPVQRPQPGEPLADADMVVPELESFEARLAAKRALGGGTAPPPGVGTATLVPRTARLPGVSDRTLGSPRSAAAMLHGGIVSPG